MARARVSSWSSPWPCVAVAERLASSDAARAHELATELQVPGVPRASRWPTARRRRRRPSVPTSSGASPTGRATPRSARLRRQVRRVDPAVAPELGSRADRVDPSRRRRSRSAPRASCSRCARTRREPHLHATAADEGLVDRERGVERMTDDREELEQERDFLMQSLDDLEVEHDSGGIDDESYPSSTTTTPPGRRPTIRALRDGVDVAAGPGARAGAAPTRRAHLRRGGVRAGRRTCARGRARRPPARADRVGQHAESSTDDAASKRLGRTIKTLEAAGQREPRRLRPPPRARPRVRGGRRPPERARSSPTPRIIDRPEPPGGTRQRGPVALPRVGVDHEQGHAGAVRDRRRARHSTRRSRRIRTTPRPTSSGRCSSSRPLQFDPLRRPISRRYLVKAPNGPWAERRARSAGAQSRRRSSRRRLPCPDRPDDEF